MRYSAGTRQVRAVVRERLSRELRTDDLEKHFGMDARHVGFEDFSAEVDFSVYFDDLPCGIDFDPFGIPFVAGTRRHVKHELYPMVGFDSLEQVLCVSVARSAGSRQSGSARAPIPAAARSLSISATITFAPLVEEPLRICEPDPLTGPP